MRQVIKVNEYYDLFDIKNITTTTTSEPTAGTLTSLTNVPAAIKDTQQYNPFRGFWNNEQYNTQQLAYDNTPITGQIKSPQAQNSLRIDDNGDIWCYPPNVSVPYWSRVIFRNYDYDFAAVPTGNYSEIIDRKGSKVLQYQQAPTTSLTLDNLEAVEVPIPENLWKKNNTDGSIDPRSQFKHNYSAYGVDGSVFYGTIYDYSHLPLFLRFDEYPSRSKVIFSECDKTRNPDIEYRFAYQKGQMEPIKLNLSLSANTPIRDPSTPGNIYNYNLRKEDIKNLLQTCYWCIEWIYEPDTH